jgi:hypothetical protein
MKLCRAFECPRSIDDNQLFCSVHVELLRGAPKVYTPVKRNIEPARAGTSREGKRIADGFPTARDWIAKKEGRASRLIKSRKIAEGVEPTTSGPTTTTTDRYKYD